MINSERRPVPKKKRMSAFQKWTIIGPLFVVIISFLFNYKWNNSVTLTLDLKNDSIPIENIKLFLVREHSAYKDSTITDFQGRAVFENLAKGSYKDSFLYLGSPHEFLINVRGGSDLRFTQNIKNQKTKIYWDLPSVHDGNKKTFDSVDSKAQRHNLNTTTKSGMLGTVVFYTTKNYALSLRVDGVFVMTLNSDVGYGLRAYKEMYFKVGSKHYWTSYPIEKKHYFTIDTSYKRIDVFSDADYAISKKPESQKIQFDTVAIPIMPGTSDHWLTISSFPDQDIPEFYQLSDYTYNTTYPANAGVVIFWTNCKDCNWYVSRDNLEYTQGVIVSTSKPKFTPQNAIYIMLQTGKVYKFYVCDKSRKYFTTLSLQVSHGETKFVEIDKKQ